jgi:hypothetical protein
MMQMLLGLRLSDEEFSLITSLTQALPYSCRADFFRALVAELTTSGAHNPGVVRKIGQRLQARFLGAHHRDRGSRLTGP